jgi:hypothetical protein
LLFCKCFRYDIDSLTVELPQEAMLTVFRQKDTQRMHVRHAMH